MKGGVEREGENEARDKEKRVKRGGRQGIRVRVGDMGRKGRKCLDGGSNGGDERIEKRK